MDRSDRWDRWDRWDHFQPSIPRPVKGGIRLQSKQGHFAQSWWAKRWIAVLESFQLGGRLGRGRSYARQGQVTEISVGRGTVAAQVQGSRPDPYEVGFRVKPISKEDWRKVADAVSRQAIFGAKLLGGEMPHEIEDVFRSAGVSLFPEKRNDLTTECSCPDPANPCKHIAAVYYLLGEEFDRDPFLIFQLRGISREEFFALLGETPASTIVSEEAPPEPLEPSPQIFWNGGALPDDLIGVTELKPAGAALPRRLGKFPFWRGQASFFDTLDSIYNSAAVKAIQRLTDM